MNENEARQLLTGLSTAEPILPAFDRVRLKAAFEDRAISEHAPFRPLIWIELWVHALAGVSLAALAVILTAAIQ